MSELSIIVKGAAMSKQNGIFVDSGKGSNCHLGLMPREQDRSIGNNS